MTDRPQDGAQDRPDDRVLTPAEEERVRRLLADARHTEPMPGDIAARLDAVLAGLAAEGVDDTGAGAAEVGERAAAAPGGAEPAAAEPVAPVADLAAARRRRRRVTQVLVAAAAVTVVGVAGPQLLGGGADMMAGQSESTTAEDAGSADTAGGSAPQAAEQDGAQDSGGEESGEARSSAAAPQLTEDSLARLARGLQKSSPDSSYALERPSGASVKACRAGAVWGPGRRVLVTYDGADAALVYRPPADGSQTVDLFLCGDDVPTRTLTLPAP